MSVFIYVKKFLKRQIVLLLCCIYTVLTPRVCHLLYTLHKKLYCATIILKNILSLSFMVMLSDVLVNATTNFNPIHANKKYLV